jgi:sugar/nucleoside kinase (ribokinase family)
VIVVVGAVRAAWAEGGGPHVAPSGLAAGIALAAASAGAAVEIVTRLGEDTAGDELLLAFAAARVGHVATLRDAVHATPIAPAPGEPVDPSDDLDDAPDQAVAAPAAPRPTLDAADVELALRYLSDYRVIVVIHPADAGIVREAVAATAWASAHLVVVSEPGAATPGDLPTDSVLLAASDDAEAVASLLGRYAAAIDGGEAPAEAFQATLGAIG